MYVPIERWRRWISPIASEQASNRSDFRTPASCMCFVLVDAIPMQNLRREEMSEKASDTPRIFHQKFPFLLLARTTPYMPGSAVLAAQELSNTSIPRSFHTLQNSTPSSTLLVNKPSTGNSSSTCESRLMAVRCASVLHMELRPR